MSLNAKQTAHAKTILAEVKRHKLPKRAGVVAMETALVESNITIYANRNVPASLKIPHEAVGSDHASVGIFQQQVPSWGTAADCMDPAHSARKFLDRLVTFNWSSMSTGAAAQRVQVSAFPSRYQQQEARATEIVNSLWGGAPAPVPGPHPTLHRKWPSYMKSGDYFGLISGPARSRGGANAIERPDVKAIQQRLIALGFVPGVKSTSSSWADGLFEQPTAKAVAAWQHKHMPGTQFYGQVWGDDWAKLFTY
jgi:hypothetical protein